MDFVGSLVERILDDDVKGWNIVNKRMGLRGTSFGRGDRNIFCRLWHPLLFGKPLLDPWRLADIGYCCVFVRRKNIFVSFVIELN